MTPRQLAELVAAHAAALVLYARQWCACAEDVVQDAFVKLAQQTAVPDQPRPWLYRVVRNEALLAARRLARRRRREERASTGEVWFVCA